MTPVVSPPPRHPRGSAAFALPAPLHRVVVEEPLILELNAAMSPGGTRNPVSPSSTWYGIPQCCSR